MKLSPANGGGGGTKKVDNIKWFDLFFLFKGMLTPYELFVCSYMVSSDYFYLIIFICKQLYGF